MLIFLAVVIWYCVKRRMLTKPLLVDKRQPHSNKNKKSTPKYLVPSASRLFQEAKKIGNFAEIASPKINGKGTRFATFRHWWCQEQAKRAPR